MEKHWKRYQKNLQKSPGGKSKKAVFFFIILGVGFFLLTGPFFQNSIQGITPEISKLSKQFSPVSVHSDSVSFKRDFTPTFRTVEGGRFVEDVDPETRVVYTLDPVLQNEMEQLFARYRVPYGIFVAMDPTTGRLLAMVEYSEDNPSLKHLAMRATYPAASIFKLVTAADAMEKGKAGPDTVIRFRGGLYEMNPKYWKDSPKRDRNKITLTDALAKSCNVAFAKVALKSLSAQDLRNRAVLFGFNRDLDFELPMDVSTIRIGSDEKSLAMTAAGFGDVRMSPLHGAMVAAMIANNGVMMSPRIVERVIRGGEEVYALRERSLGNAIRPETAEKLAAMMVQTVRKGTSKHAFYGWGNIPSLQDILVGGKTGSLEGDNPPGDYNWFVGMAPIRDAKIAVAALVINHNTWQIKASYVAREGLKTYFQKSSQVISQNRAVTSRSVSKG